MIEKIKKIVSKYPDRIAYKVHDESITYKKLWDCAYCYAQFLKRQGNSPVIIYGNKDIWVVKAILACIIANRAYVSIGLCTPINRIKDIIILTNSTLILSKDKIDGVDCIDIEELVRYKDNKIIDNNNDIVYIIFTSGSTGTPKGVPISKDNLDNFIDWISNLEPLCDYKNINVLNQASFSFDLSVADFYYSLCNGHTLIAYDGDIQDDYNDIFAIISNVDVAVMTPTFMKLCLLNKDFNYTMYPNFKCIYFCGEQLEVKLVKKIYEVFPDIKIINAYGPTEATSAVSSILITKDMANTLDLLPVGEVGKFAIEIIISNNEIVLKGKSVFRGYLGNYNGGYYNDNGINCYRTGDIGYISNGMLFCKGRMDNQVKYKGYRIELGDIENNINKIDGVSNSVVIAKYNEDNIVKSIKAFVVLDNKHSVEYIKDELIKYVPLYMIPNSIKIIDKLPINQNGKIDRKALSEL